MHKPCDTRCTRNQSGLNLLLGGRAFDFRQQLQIWFIITSIESLTVAQLTHDRTRTVLAVLGIAFAVLATTLLASVRYGVVETGQQKFDDSGRDLWMTGGPVQLAPGSVGGFKNSVTNAHAVSV